MYSELRPHKGPSETGEIILPSAPFELRPHKGPSETHAHGTDMSITATLRPHKGPSETGSVEVSAVPFTTTSTPQGSV